VPARELEPGDEVFTSKGGWWRVGSATWLQGTRTVHNLEVADFHTYFVGDAQAWVHNNACPWLGNNVSPSGTYSKGPKRGYDKATSDLDGGMKKATETFEDLTGRKPKIDNPKSKSPTDTYEEPGKIEVRFRPNSNSDTPAIEVVDHGAESHEKIHINP